MNLRDYQSVQDRRNALSNLLGQDLDALSAAVSDEKSAQAHHAECMIGYTTVPLGVIGPARIHSVYSVHNSLAPKKLYENCSVFIPLATTEGALIASVNRGSKAISSSGGLTVFVETVGASRSPVFKAANLSEVFRLQNYISSHLGQIEQVMQKTSSHIQLSTVDFAIAGTRLFVRFVCDTKKAMGLNMITIASYQASEYISQQTKVEFTLEAGNFDADKKPAVIHGILGRGKRVWAEALIPEQVLREVLKTTGPKLYDAWETKVSLGSTLAQSLGHNCHVANIAAAFFIATGQDPAHVVEASLAHTVVEKENDDSVRIALSLPSLMIGSVGGGMRLKNQQTALAMICSTKEDENSSELVASACAFAMLAGELSLLSALSAKGLSQAHQKIARGESV